MRSRFLTRRPELLFAALALALGGCGESGEGGSFSAPDQVIAGPQGLDGQFVVECELAHRAPDDPIVHPGHAGASHLHQFFGAIGVSVDTTYREMLVSETTCDQQADTASYWAPVLVDSNQEPIEPIRSVAYYRAGPGVEPTSVVPYPPGLMLIAGDAHAVEPQELSLVAWSCGTGSKRSETPIDCSGAPSLRMIVTFPDCWNGVDIRSRDWVDPAARHAVYSAAGECPESHPVAIPQLQFAIDYPPVDPEGLALSSGDVLGGHADFWNAWDPDKLRNEVTRCIHGNLVCGVTG